MHHLTINEIMNMFSSSSEGLSLKQVKLNEEKYGKNKLISKKQTSLIIVFFKNLLEPMMLILLISLLFTIIISIIDIIRFNKYDFKESYGILFAIILSNVINLWMEIKSRKAYNSLFNLQNSGTSYVKRENNIIKIKSEDIVIGDILVLNAGEKIYADARIIDSINLKVNESSLTGETDLIEKHNTILDESTILAERKNMIYSGTFVIEGSASAIVTSIGYETELGKIAYKLKSNEQDLTPLERQLAHLSKVLVIIGCIVASIMFIMSIILSLLNNTFSAQALNDMFITSTIYLVSAVPEGLPGIVAISLALNVVKMSKNNALVKKMVAVETIGCVNVICSDKTGTLTKNNMEFSCLYEADLTKKYKPTNINLINNIMNNHTVYNNEGNPTECAILKIFDKVTIDKNRVIITPFSSENKYMEIKINNTYYIKGAPEVILNKCDLSKQRINKILTEIEYLQLKAYRIICYASKINQNLYTFDGFVCLIDPIKEEVYEAVKTAIDAEIKVIVITGDAKNTAVAICDELKLLTKDSIISSGEEIEKLNNEELKNKLQNLICVYRATPLVKLKIIQGLKELDYITAMTGDGINDALALNEADVGLAMNIKGTEVAKEACDIVLLDDSFKTIITAISFGRNIYKNFKRFIIFQVTVNISFIILILFTMLLGYTSPFKALELLWINIIMDGPPALALGTEKLDNEKLEVEVHKRSDKILDTKMLIKIFISSIFIAGFCIIQTKFNIISCSINQQKSVIFSMFVFMQIINIFNIHEHKINFFKQKILMFAIILTLVLQIVIVNYWSSFFELEPLELILWIKIAILVLVNFIFIKLIKRLLKYLKLW